MAQKVKPKEAMASTTSASPSALPALATEMDARLFLRAMRGARFQGAITDVPYGTKERYRAIGTTTRLKDSDASSNPWFATMATSELCDVLADLYECLDDNAYAAVYVDADTALLLAHALGVPQALEALQKKATSKAPRDRIGFAWWTPLTWGKVSRKSYVDDGENGTITMTARPGGGYHFPSTTEQILLLEKGKSQLHRRYGNLFLAPRPQATMPGCTKKSATAKPPEIAEKITRALSLPGGRIVDPFVGCGTHAEGIIRAGCQPIVNDIDLSTFRDWMKNGFKREWWEVTDGAWKKAG